jgi:cell shape-determining protein MreC
MHKFSYRSYLVLGFTLLLLMSLPSRVAHTIRSGAVSVLSFPWRALNVVGQQEASENERLSQENHLLKAQIKSVRQWLLDEERLQKQVQLYEKMGGKAKERDFFKRRSEELKAMLDLELSSLPAKVIFRQPALWGSSLWINVGEKNNRKVGKKIVCKNSPVILRSSIVGVIEFVSESSSRVRLITDSSLAISVRALRGESQNLPLLESIDSLLTGFETRPDLREALAQCKQQLLATRGDQYLAKGELKGGSLPLWRSKKSLLKGVGFNYDFADREGPALDLRSGEPRGAKGEKSSPLRLIQVGDLLVTTGLDGLFPAGFSVATVASVQTLKEGASSYELQAFPQLKELETLSHVSVLPPYSSLHSE